MRLLRLHDVEIGARDRVFRHSRLLALIVRGSKSDGGFTAGK
jgi:hypothetical protein